MPKSQSADTLLKRLQKIQRAQARLSDITTRIRAQADLLAELLAVAQGFIADGDTPKAAPTAPPRRARSTAAARKRPATRRTATRRPTPPATTARPSRTAATATAARATTRRAARKPASI